jgi:hypothetical protein
MVDDFELVTEFARNGSEEAFRVLVERHSGMVRGVAMRVAGEAAADEITQAVFVILARKAGRGRLLGRGCIGRRGLWRWKRCARSSGDGKRTRRFR